MMPGHGANFFNKKKIKIGRPGHSLNSLNTRLTIGPLELTIAPWELKFRL